MGKKPVSADPQRRNYSNAEVVDLLSQVDRRCPRCGVALFHIKSKRSQKLFELAHIYPLNPTAAEADLLAGEERLSDDVNHPDNIIPLCPNCHTKFDRPRTVDDYRELVALKKQIIEKLAQHRLQSTYLLEVELKNVIEALCTLEPETPLGPLELEPKRLSQKLGQEMPGITAIKIRQNVTSFYTFIKMSFLELERASPNSSQLIYSQVRTYYLKQKSLGHSNATIFANVADWIRYRCNPTVADAADIIASFFVQNCEVFE